MATSIKLKSDIKKIEAAIKSKATPKSLVSKLQVQLDKLKSDLASLSSAKPKKGVTKTKVLSSLQKLKAKIKSTKSLSGYKRSGIDIEKDADVPALPLGRRTAKTTGNTYYEYRLNRADVKQPPKRYPKLEDGGMMARGGKITDKQMQRLDSGFEFIIYTDLPRQYGQYHISISKEKGDVVYTVKSGHVASSKKVKTFTSEKDAFDYLTNKFGVKVSRKKMDYADGGKLNNKYILSFNYNPSNLSNVDAERIVTKYTKNWKHDNDFDEVSFYVFNLTKEDADMLSKELKMENVYNIELDYSRYANGGMMAMGGMTEHGLMIGDMIVDEKDNGMIIVSNEQGYHVVDLPNGKRERIDFKMASGGRTLSAINRDRAYKSNQPWEQNYTRKSRPKNPKYQSSSDVFEEGGEMHRLFDEGEM